MAHREGWEDGCIEYAENVNSPEPHEHNTHCRVIAEAIAEDIEYHSQAGTTRAYREWLSAE